MTQYISKNAIVAEIESLKRITFTNFDEGVNYAVQILLETIDTLEVKEVDIEESARHYLLNEHKSPLNEVFHQADLKAEMQYHEDVENAFKAGFKLGLKAQKGE